MTKYREFRWKIGAYTAETMPFERLLEYLGELRKMLGESEHLHLIKVDSSSTAPVFHVDNDEAAARIEARALAIRTGTAPKEARQSFRKINGMLREDKTDASFAE